MQSYKHFLTSTIALLLIIFITGPKIYKLFQIKGHLPGAISQNITITDKWNDNDPNHPNPDSAYWICWDNVNIKKVSSKRINLQKDTWDVLKIDDIIEIKTFKNDKWPYSEYSILASFEKNIFNYILLMAELICFIIFQIKGIKNYGKK